MARSLRPSCGQRSAWPGESLCVIGSFQQPIKLGLALGLVSGFLAKRCRNISSGDSSASLTSHLRGYFGSMTLTSSELTGGLRFLAVAQAWPLYLLTTAGTWPVWQNPGKLLLPHSWVHLLSSPTSLRDT